MILSYSIISSVILMFCFLVYRLLISGTRQHAMNRRLLLSIYVASLIFPFAILAVMLHSPEAVPEIGKIEIGELTYEIASNVGEEAQPITPDFTLLLLKIFVIGVIATSIYFLFGLYMLWNITRKGESSRFGSYNLILVDDSYKISPFSWRDFIVMRRSDFEEDGDMILIHEYAHLKLLHWSDLLLAYFVICIQWYNPAAWAMREELKAIHEYQADETVIESGVDAKQYQLLLVKRAVSSGYQSFANSLNHSKLKKRVTMMYKKKTSLRRKLFALALIPAIGAGIAVTSIPSVAGALESMASSPAAAPVMSDKTPAPESRTDVYTAVEKMPEYPGGMGALMKFLGMNIRYPEEAQKANEQGRVIVKFIVNQDGSVSDPEIVKGVSESLDKEALRVVSALPKWTPGTVKGKPVATYFTLPLSFKLQTDDTPQEQNPQ